MKDKFFRTWTIGIAIIMLTTLFGVACKSSDNNPPPNPRVFDKNNFQIVITRKEVRSNLSIEYDIKNASSQNYSGNQDADWYLKFSIAAVDGVVYSNDFIVGDIQAGVTVHNYAYINFPSGKEVSMNTFKYELILK